MPPPEDKQGFRFYQDVLGNPKYVLAPMVDASELAWRMLARKYSAQLCTYCFVIHMLEDVNCNN